MKRRELSRTDLSQYMYQAIAENEHESLYWKDLDSKFILVSKYLVKMFGKESLDEVVGKSDFDFFPDAFAKESYADEQAVIATGQPLLGKIESSVMPDGTYVQMATSKFPLRDLNGSIVGTWGHSIDVGSQRRTDTGKIRKAPLTDEEMALFDKAQTDLLTGLPNVKQFYEYINLFYQDAMNNLSMMTSDHVLMLIDLDKLEAVNKAHGLACGDKAIQHAARIIEKEIREGDHAYRLEGDEFAILLKVFDYPEAVDVAERLRKTLADTPMTCEKGTLSLTASIGMSRFEERLPYGTIYDIINHSEMRVSRAKSTGNACVSDDDY